MPDLDALRALYPHLGLAVYAYAPGGPVTVEAHTADGTVFPATGATVEEALLRLFPELAREQTAEPVDPFS